MTLAHAELGASNMHRWANCPGSVRLSKGIPSKTSDYAKEGTFAHDVAADICEIIKGYYQDYVSGKTGLECFLSCIVSDGDIANHYRKIAANKELSDPKSTLEAVETYVQYFVDLLETLPIDERNQILIEQRLNLSAVYEGCFGTGDLVVYSGKFNKLYVIDFKHGAGLPVEAENNMQLQYYGLGALLEIDEPCENVELVVVQPRCPHPHGPIRSWEIESFDLLDFSGQLIKYADKTKDPDAPLNAGSWCQFCPAKHICPSLRDEAQSIASNVFNPISNSKEIGRYLSLIPRLKEWIKAVEDHAMTEARNGNIPMGFKFVAGRGRKAWNTEEDEIASYLYDYGFQENELYEKKFLSPAKLQKLLGKSKKEIDHFISYIEGAPKLVSERDKREEIQIAATDVFNKIGE